MKNRKGFSLIEFLIALAIMSILSAAILVGLNSSKIDARDDAAILAANEAVDKVLDCMDKNATVIMANNPICVGGGDKPSLPPGWAWTVMTGDNNTKRYRIRITAGTKIITCTNDTTFEATATADGRCITSGI